MSYLTKHYAVAELRGKDRHGGTSTDTRYGWAVVRYQRHVTEIVMVYRDELVAHAYCDFLTKHKGQEVEER